MAEAPPLWEESPPVPDFTARPPRPEGLERLAAVTLGLVPRVDPVERDFRNRALGHAGEALVVEGERRRLEQADRPDLARKVRWVTQEDGPETRVGRRLRRPLLPPLRRRPPSGGEDHLWRQPHAVCFLTRNEKGLSDERPDAFRILRVYEFGQAPRLFRLRPPLGEAVVLETETWRAGFG